MNKYDIQRTVNICHPVTGAQIIDTLKLLVSKTRGGCYREETLRDIDGQHVLEAGIASCYPYENMVIRTGEDLSTKGIELTKTYEKIGIVNTESSWGMFCFAVVYSEQDVIDAVEKMRDGLEELL